MRVSPLVLVGAVLLAAVAASAVTFFLTARSHPSAPAVKWSHRVAGGISFSSPIVGPDGTVYLGQGSRLRALRPDGTEIWNAETDCIYNYNPARAADGTLYWATSNGAIYAFNADGSRKWKVEIGHVALTDTAVGPDGTIYVGTQESAKQEYAPEVGRLYAITPQGRLKWHYQIPEGKSIDCDPVVDAHGNIYFGAFDTHLHCVLPDGKRKWTVHVGDYIGAVALDEAGATLYACSDDKTYAFGLDGVKKWDTGVGCRTISSKPVARGGMLYIPGEDWTFYALDSAGAVKWSYPAGGKLKYAPAVTETTAYVSVDGGPLLALDRLTGKLLWELKLKNTDPRAQPAVAADGTVYLACGDSSLRAIGPQ